MGGRRGVINNSDRRLWAHVGCIGEVEVEKWIGGCLSEAGNIDMLELHVEFV